MYGAGADYFTCIFTEGTDGALTCPLTSYSLSGLSGSLAPRSAEGAFADNLAPFTPRLTYGRFTSMSCFAGNLAPFTPTLTDGRFILMSCFADTCTDGVSSKDDFSYYTCIAGA